MDKLYSFSFEVEGRGNFPLDMLRYDRCFPRDGDSAAMMDGKERRTIKMEGTSSRKFGGPTAGRWASFGWTVVKS